MKYKVILWDLDGTLTDFLAAEKAAIRKCFEIIGLGECTDEMLARYSAINVRYWQLLERGEMTKDQILVERFREFFALEGLDVDKAYAFNEEYQLRLGDTIVFCDDSFHIVEDLKGKVLQCLVTNGTRVSQENKLKNSGFDRLFDYFFISDIVGYEKPAVEFFDAVFAKIGDYSKEDVLIIGDSLTSDIKGGNNVGIDTCWYNPRGEYNDKNVQVTYEIRDLHEIYDIMSASESTCVHD